MEMFMGESSTVYSIYCNWKCVFLHCHVWPSRQENEGQGLCAKAHLGMSIRFLKENTSNKNSISNISIEIQSFRSISDPRFYPVDSEMPCFYRRIGKPWHYPPSFFFNSNGLHHQVWHFHHPWKPPTLQKIDPEAHAAKSRVICIWMGLQKGVYPPNGGFNKTNDVQPSNCWVFPQMFRYQTHFVGFSLQFSGAKTYMCMICLASCRDW